MKEHQGLVHRDEEKCQDSQERFWPIEVSSSHTSGFVKVLLCPKSILERWLLKVYFLVQRAEAVVSSLCNLIIACFEQTEHMNRQQVMLQE